MRFSAPEGQSKTRIRFFLATLLTLLLVLGITARTPRLDERPPDLSAYPWPYLRGGEPLAAGEHVVELVAVGDVMLGRGVAGEPRPFAAVAPWLRAADLALGNLECVIALEEGDTPRPGPPDDPPLGPYRLYAPPSAARALREAGFDVLGLANNHALDRGPAGLAAMASRLQAAGIATVGAGPSPEAALEPLIRQVDGVRLAFLAFNAVPDPAEGRVAGAEVPGQGENWTRAGWDRTQAVAAIKTAHARADAVVVSVHWGYEYETRADPAQQDAAQALLEAGADLVIGHHPHVVQDCQVAAGPAGSPAGRSRFVAYSLGNFVFDQEGEETRHGLALRAFFDDRGLRAVQALPVRAGPRPRLMGPDEAASLLARVQPPPRHVGFACDARACRPITVPETPEKRGGPFWGGEIDLTGDGVPERVRRAGERVTVYQDGVVVWQSPPAWRVVDLALGDPNDDGRGELLLALWKPDAAGVARSHPFVVGYRGGIYRALWGGSAVSEPIHEVELGDVDGDGVQELVVLEEWGDGSERAVAVWRWHGWGFSLAWRSPPGRYRDLVLTPGEAGGPPTIRVTAAP
jgi:poly-gamma-glutamate capsule biosynthesis protein CapA/YwtB (metallophosphatase superfamily)